MASAKTYYVSVAGNDASPGNLNQPFATWQKGFTSAVAGDTVFIRGGIYYASGVEDNNGYYCGVVQHDKDGTQTNPIVVWAYPGEMPVLDCRNMTQPASHLGIYFENCDYWHLKGLTVTRADQKSGYGAAGIKIYSGNNLTLERIVSHHNGGSGIQIVYSSEKNLLLNCDTYSNYDPFSSPPGEHADGIEIADIIERNGNERVNTMKGCRSWDNGDDGFDHFRCEGILVFENCWAWHNGYIPGTESLAGNGVGFKLGMAKGTPESVAQRTLVNCIAHDNRTTGFSQEEANVIMKFYNNISCNNSNQAYIFAAYNTYDILKNNISYKNGSDGIFQSRQTIDHNSWQNGLTVTASDFLSLDGTQLAMARKSDGSLPSIDFMRLATGSDLIDAGTNVGLPFSGVAPDIGCFETSSGSVQINQNPVVAISAPATNSSYTLPASVTLTVTASDPDGTIKKVELYNGTVKLGEKTSAPFSFPWTILNEGTFTITAVATDNLDSKTVSAPITVRVTKPAATVNQPPLISIASPAKSESFPSPATITIDINATDPDGLISKVELFNGTEKLGEITSAPYTFTLKDLTEGNYSLTAIATDNLKASSTSTVLSILVTSLNEPGEYFNLYPNPSDGRFSISLTAPLEADNFTVTVVNLIGKVVYKEDLLNVEETKQFDLSHLRPGTYILMISGNQILATQKFIKV